MKIIDLEKLSCSEIDAFLKKGITVDYEGLLLIYNNSIRFKHSIFLNKKKQDKFEVVIKNNISKKSVFNVKLKLVKQAFYKGDWEYFRGAYTYDFNGPFSKLIREKIYISTLD